MKINKLEISDLIERFISGDVGDYEWDDFTSSKIKDPEIAKIQEECILISDRFPSKNPNIYCSEAGTRELENLAKQLRSK